VEFLNKIFDKLLSLLPRRIFVDPFERGIRITYLWKQRITDLEPGVYFIWPLLQQVIRIGVKTQTMDLRSQSIFTKDHKDIIISGSLIYKIRDARKAICEVMDFDKGMCVLSLGIIKRYVSQHTLNELVNTDDLTKEIKREISTTCSKWGIYLQSVEITDTGRGRNIRLLTNNENPMMEVV